MMRYKGFSATCTVARGTGTVAIKVLAESTPRKIFANEDMEDLYHPNMIELLYASSASGDQWRVVLGERSQSLS